MKIREVRDIFDHFVDKFRDESVLSFEFCRYINNAQIKLFTEAFHNKSNPKSPMYAFDHTEYDVERWRPCVVTFDSEDREKQLHTDEDGCIAVSKIQEFFPDDVVRDYEGEIEVKKPDVLKFLNAARFYKGEFVPCRWSRHNEIRRDERNPYRLPTTKYPVIIIEGEKYRILPKGSTQIVMTVARMPLNVWYDEDNVSNNIDPELPDSTMLDVIIEAVKYAGVNIRERDLFAYMDRENKKPS